MLILGEHRVRLKLPYRLSGANIMLSNLAELWRDDSGATAVEYGLIAAMVSIACIAALRAIGTAEVGLYQSILAAVFNSTSESLSGNDTP